MVSKQERMHQKCSQYLEKDIRENLQMSQLLLENPFLGVLITKDDRVFTLGAGINDYFGLGPVSEIPQLTKIDSLCGKKICQFAACDYHILALSHCGVVYAWGCNENGQLGNNTEVNSSVPVVVAGDLKDEMVIQIECGYDFSAALTDNGKVFTWGNNEHGRTGHGTNSGLTKSPRVVEGLLSGVIIIKLACKWMSLLCLSREGKVFGFGSNCYGYLGINTTEYYQGSPAVAKIPEGVNVQDLTSGSGHALAVTDNGDLWAWGSNGHGQLGTGNTNNHLLPIRIELDNRAAGSIRVTRIFAEGWTSFAMDDLEDVFVWGSVNGETVMRPTKRNIAFPVTSRITTPSNMGCTLVLDLLNSFDRDDFSDFVISVEGKDIHVHKAILQMRSRYFRTMFRNDWKETESCKVRIEHCSYEVYYEFLRYLYCGLLRDLDPVQSMQLMDLATMTLHDELVKLCEKRIKKQMTVENLLKIFSAALVLEKEDLADNCVRRLDLTKMDEIIGSAAFEEIPPEHLRDFFRKCKLNGAFKAK